MFFSRRLISLVTASLLFFKCAGLSSAENSASPACVRLSLEPLFAIARDLEQQNLLDGEILVAFQDQVILHLTSRNLASQNNQFMIGSVSKQFFAVALLRTLYDQSLGNTEEEKIEKVRTKLHLPLSQYIPENSSLWYGSMPSWANMVTLHHLLTHTSGIVDYTSSDEFSAHMTNGKRFAELPHSPAEIIGLIINKELLFSPGSRASYSNTGYFLIAEVIKSITQQPLDEYLQKTLFIPLGLTRTYHVAEGNWYNLKRDRRFLLLAPERYYDPTNREQNVYPPNSFIDMSVAQGAGSIISTANDLLIWNLAMHRTEVLLPKKLYELMITTDLDEYGYGIGIENSKQGAVLGHIGVIDSYQTLLCYLPEQELSIIMLSNIAVDETKINLEFMNIYTSIENQDNQARFEEALKILEERYPPYRGLKKVLEILRLTLF